METNNEERSNKRQDYSCINPPSKRAWIATIRPIRDELKQLRESGKISPSVYRLYYRKAKGGVYTSRRNLKQHMVADGNLKEEEI